jgi:hypothetical protein
MWRGRGTVHEIWLSEGLGYTRENACPFCGQTVDGAVALIGATVGNALKRYLQTAWDPKG